jgi:hypothetical protein
MVALFTNYKIVHIAIRREESYYMNVAICPINPNPCDDELLDYVFADYPEGRSEADIWRAIDINRGNIE